MLEISTRLHACSHCTTSSDAFSAQLPGSTALASNMLTAAQSTKDDADCHSSVGSVAQHIGTVPHRHAQAGAGCAPAGAREHHNDHRAQRLHAQLLPAVVAGVEHAAADALASAAVLCDVVRPRQEAGAWQAAHRGISVTAAARTDMQPQKRLVVPCSSGMWAGLAGMVAHRGISTS